MSPTEPSTCYRAFRLDIWGPPGLSLSACESEKSREEADLTLIFDGAADALTIDEACQLIHDIEDFPGGPIFRVWRGEASFWVDYSDWRVRLDPEKKELRYTYLSANAQNRSSDDLFLFSLAVERVFLPLYLLLLQADKIGIHGSAVVLDGRAYLFIGRSGAGKSTTAYEFVRRGAQLLADDLIVVDPNTGHALGGVPSLRLWKGEGALPEAREDRGIWQHERSKRWFRMPEELAIADSAPIAAVILLDPDSAAAESQTNLRRLTPTLQAPSQRQALVDLLGQTFDLSDPDRDWMVARFKNASRLIREFPYYQFRYQKSQDGRPTHVDALFAAIASLP